MEKVSLLMSALLLTSVSTKNALHAASSMGTQGPPKGHPVPLFKSTSTLSAAAVRSVNCRARIHSGER